MTRIIFAVSILAPLLLVIAVSSAAAGGHASARSMAMAGAVTSLAAGVDAARHNPANLGLEDHQSTGIELIGLGVNVNNNAITLDDYNKYTGAVLSEADKNDILGKIPNDGLHLVADMEASVLSVSRGPFALTLTGVGIADVNLSKDILELVLNGNSFEQQISFNGTYSDAIAYFQTSLSYGRPVYTMGTRQLALGASLKYLRGLAIERITELEGGINTRESGFEGAGRMVAQTATGGSGFGLDIGAALRLDDDYTVGVSFRNFLSSISWSKNTEEHGYLFSFDTMTVDNMEDDYVVSEDYSKEISGFSTNLPTVMTVGLANTSGSLLWAVDWEQGFRRAAGASSKPRLSGGIEYWPIRQIPLRAGFGTGGSKGTGFSIGSGVRVSVFHFDVAAMTGNSLSPSSSRGLNFAITTGLDF